MNDSMKVSFYIRNYLMELKQIIINAFSSLYPVCIGVLLSFWLAVWPLMIAMVVLPVIDMITGVLAAKQMIKIEINKTGIATKKITSRRMFRTWRKMTAYLLGVIVAYAVDQLFVKVSGMTPPISIMYAMVFPMFWTEVKSIDENINRITGASILTYVKNIPSYIESIKSKGK